MNWLNRIRPKSLAGSKTEKNNSVPEGLWKKCLKCQSPLYRPELERNMDVCPKCGYHLRIGARKRISIFIDKDTFKEFGEEYTTKNPLKFKDLKSYDQRIKEAVNSTGENEALVTGMGKLNDLPVVVAAFEFRFMGGSMGGIVGTKFVEAVDFAIKENLPLICFSTSGGARMQESMISLMQMAKTSAALERLKKSSLPYFSVMIDPIFGGVSASLAMLGDINIAEPGALVGFAGRRVIEDTVRVELPDGFQKAEFLLEHGAIDMIVHRTELRATISDLISKLHKNQDNAVV